MGRSIAILALCVSAGCLSRDAPMSQKVEGGEAQPAWTPKADENAKAGESAPSPTAGPVGGLGSYGHGGRGAVAEKSVDEAQLNDLSPSSGRHSVVVTRNGYEATREPLDVPPNEVGQPMPEPAAAAPMPVTALPPAKKLAEVEQKVSGLKERVFRARAKLPLLREEIGGDALRLGDSSGSMDWGAADDGDEERTEEDEEEREKEPATGFWNNGHDRLEGEDKRADRGKDGKLQVTTSTIETIDHGEMDDSWEQPLSFIPSQCYVENTYLGGNAAYLEQLRRLDQALAQQGVPHRLAVAPPQEFDAPDKAGMGLSASLSARSFGKPGRVFLQVGLQGSQRYGWRRPPLEVALVLDAQALAGGSGVAVDLIRALLKRLGPKDSLGVVLSGGTPTTVAALSGIRSLRTSLVPRLHELEATRFPASDLQALGRAMSAAGAMLEQAAMNRTTLPGTQIALVLTSGSDGPRIAAARQAAHDLTVRGVVTSLMELGSTSTGAWWPVANAGHGNYHRVAGEDVAAAVDDELESLARVVARLLRLNVKLAPGVRAVRVLGADVLGQEQVRRVKAREKATDTALSRSLGIDADRGEDDDGIQTVIPYFYGGDSHVVVIELWVEKAGAIADVSLKYKDMVSLQNATARTAANLRNVPRRDTGEQLAVMSNLRGFRVADALEQAAATVDGGDIHGAIQTLRAERGIRATLPADRELLSAFERSLQQLQQADRGVAADALRMAARRRIGGSSS